MKVNKTILKASSILLLAFSVLYAAFAQEAKPLFDINSPYNESNAVRSPSGELYFSVGHHPENTGGAVDPGDIWISQPIANERWSKPLRIKSLSTSGNDVLVGFTDATSVLVYHDGLQMPQGIHLYSKVGNTWKYSQRLAIPDFKNNSSQFSGRLSTDRKSIIMSIQNEEGYGNEDIYITFKISETEWTTPLNLGPIINTFGQEQTPYLTNDNSTLYFSSNFKANGRGKDIFFSHRLDESWENWSKPKELKTANSIGSDSNYAKIFDEEELAIYTTTSNSEGMGDFMVIGFENAVIEESETLEKIAAGSEKEVNKQKDLNKVQILGQGKNNSIDYKIIIADEVEKMVLKNQDEMQREWGLWNWNYIEVSAKGYIPIGLTIEEWLHLKDNKLEMIQAKSGTKLVLSKIQFVRSTSEFANTRSIQELDILVDFMNENEQVKIRLEGHTDNVGDPELNKELSLARASKIRDYMTLKGIDFERIRIVGWGGSKPIADNSTEKGREINRRVEMYIDN